MGWEFFCQAEDGIRDIGVTGVQTCALPICRGHRCPPRRLRVGGAAHAGRQGRGRPGHPVHGPGGRRRHLAGRGHLHGQVPPGAAPGPPARGLGPERPGRAVTGAPAPEPRTVEEDTLRDDESPTGRRGTEGEVASDEQPVVVPDPRSEVVPGPDAGAPVVAGAPDEDTDDAETAYDTTDDDEEEAAPGDAVSSGAAPV